MGPECGIGNLEWNMSGSNVNQVYHNYFFYPGRAYSKFCDISYTRSP